MARELKYSTPHTDFDALQRELSGQPADSGSSNGDDRYDDEYDDDYRR